MFCRAGSALPYAAAALPYRFRVTKAAWQGTLASTALMYYVCAVDAVGALSLDVAFPGIVAFLRRVACGSPSGTTTAIPLTPEMLAIGESILSAPDLATLDERLEDAALEGRRSAEGTPDAATVVRAGEIRDLLAAAEGGAAIYAALEPYLGLEAARKATRAVSETTEVIRFVFKVIDFLKITDERADAWIRDQRSDRTIADRLYDQDLSVAQRRDAWAFALVVPSLAALAVAMSRRERIPPWIAFRLGGTFDGLAATIAKFFDGIRAHVDGKAPAVPPESAPIAEWFRAAREAGLDDYWPSGPPNADAG